jgi:hypothetical protein
MAHAFLTNSPVNRLTADDHAALEQILVRKLKGVSPGIRRDKTRSIDQILEAPHGAFPFKS